MKRNSVIVIFLALAAATVLLLRFALPVTPDKALAAGIAKLRDVRRFSGVVTIGMLLPNKGDAGPIVDDEAAALGIPLAIRGAVAVDLPEGERKLSGETALTVVGSGNGGKEILFEMKALPDGMAFIKVDNLPAGPDAPLPVEANGVWYTLETSAAGALFGSGGKMPAVGAEAAESEAAVSDAAYKRLRGRISDGSLFTTDGGSSVEIVDGMSAYRYALGVDRAAAAEFSKDLREMLIGRRLDATETDELAKRSANEDIAATVWVDRRSLELRKLQIDVRGTGDLAEERFSFMIDHLDYGALEPASAPDTTRPFADLIELLAAKKK